MPVENQSPEGSTGVITQLSEVWAGGPELSPYAPNFVPPYPGAMPLTNYTGYETLGVLVPVSVNETVAEDTRGLTTQTFATHDLTWVAGDTAEFTFFFDNVCWTWVEPEEHTLAWECRDWKSQVRSSRLMYTNFWWPPIRPYGGMLCEFDVTATWTEDYAGNGPGTMVSLRGNLNWPGSFLWDLQTLHFIDPLNADLQDPDAYAIRTWLSGNVTIQNQVTLLSTSASPYIMEIQYP